MQNSNIQLSIAPTAANTPLKIGARALWRSSSVWRDAKVDQGTTADASVFVLIYSYVMFYLLISCAIYAHYFLYVVNAFKQTMLLTVSNNAFCMGP